jgi:putative ABC transport system ATP-binding protein
VSTETTINGGAGDHKANAKMADEYRTNANPENAIIELSSVTKTFFRGKEPLTVLDGLSLSIAEGAFEALMGPSGSGKSTLLNLIAGLDRPTSGKAIVAKNDIGALNDSQLAKFRARNVGFIFQSYNLMPVLTALENVELPLVLTSLSGAERRKRAETALRVVGLAERMDHYPRQLSGGQEQRVAIARAIVHDPTILVCDEPTGDLDRKSADEILQLLTRLNTEFKKTILMVTHDPAAAERATVTRHLNKGKLE